MIIRRSLAAGLILLSAATLRAAGVQSSDKVTKELPILLGGTFVLDNPFGDIDIVGTDDNKVVLVAEKIIRGMDKDALEEGQAQMQIAIGGDIRQRVVKTLLPPIHSSRWSGSMKYVVKVPRTVHVNVASNGTSRVRVADMRTTVGIRSFNGVVILERLMGSSTVECANSNIIFIAPEKGMADAALGTINGNIEVHAPKGTRFRWEAETIKGDLRTDFPMRGAFLGSRFRGSVNGEGGPLLSTQSLMGAVLLLQNGSKIEAARSVRPLPGGPAPGGEQSVVYEGRPLELGSVRADIKYATNLGNIIVGDIHGNADLRTGAGEVQLGSVFGDLQVRSGGGPLNFGQIIGAIVARTEAGDVLVQSAGKGGTLITGGGTIRVFYSGAEITLHTGGGDIVVRQADGPVNAETQSGDISIVLNTDLKTQKITAKTAKGHVMLTVPATFAADIDATVITSDPDVNNITTDFSGLQTRREQLGGKTKIRATGKVNGGGERLELYAEDGGIQISTRPGPQ